MILFSERINSLKQLIKHKSRTRKLSVSLYLKRSLAFAFLLMVLPSIPFDAGHEKTYAAYDKTELKLSTDTHSVVVSTEKLSVIIPGESVATRIERERKQAEEIARVQRASEEAAKRNVVSREKRVYTAASSADIESVYVKAGQAFGVDPRILKAVHNVETGGSGSTAVTSYAGAKGPMQFLPSTWRRYGVDGNGDGSAEITNVEDAIFTAAKYLKACGYPDVKKALWGYNPSQSYYNKVMSRAHSYGF